MKRGTGIRKDAPIQVSGLENASAVISTCEEREFAKTLWFEDSFGVARTLSRRCLQLEVQ